MASTRPLDISSIVEFALFTRKMIPPTAAATAARTKTTGFAARNAKAADKNPTADVKPPIIVIRGPTPAATNPVFTIKSSCFSVNLPKKPVTSLTTPRTFENIGIIFMPRSTCICFHCSCWILSLFVGLSIVLARSPCASFVCSIMTPNLANTFCCSVISSP